MKQYTTPEQTAKLIELGFERPKSEVKAEQAGDNVWCNPAYSIGELIEMLQKQVYETEYSGIPCDLNLNYDGTTWLIRYINEANGKVKSERFGLLDALYDMIISLNKEGVL